MAERVVVGEGSNPGSDSVELRAGGDDILWVCTGAGLRFFIILMFSEATPLLVFVFVFVFVLLIDETASPEKSGTLAYTCTL